MLGLVAMYVARFTRKLRRGLLLGLVAFVVAVARRFIAAIAIAIVTITATARGRGTAFVGHVPHFVVVPVFGSASLSFILFAVSLLELKFWLAAALFNIIERFKVLRDGFDRLIDKSSSGRDESIAFRLMESHVKPFESKTLVWHRNVSCRE